MVNNNKILLTKAITSRESSQLGLARAAGAAAIPSLSLCLCSQVEHPARVGPLQGCLIQATMGQRGTARCSSVFSHMPLPIWLRGVQLALRRRGHLAALSGFAGVAGVGRLQGKTAPLVLGRRSRPQKPAWTPCLTSALPPYSTEKTPFSCHPLANK